MGDNEFKNLSKAEKKRLSALANDRAPSTRKRSSQFIFHDEVSDTFGQPFEFTYVPLTKLYQMSRDPILSFGMHYIKVPIVRAPWRIECKDEQIRVFVEQNLKRIYPRFILQYLTSMNFGYQAIIKKFSFENPSWTYIDPEDPDAEEKKVWDEGVIKAVCWDNFVALPPELVEPDWNSDGEFDGILYNTTDGTNDFPFPFPAKEGKDPDSIKVDLAHALWITNEKDSVFGSVWGYPRLGYAYPYWWSYWFRWALADRHYEKDVDPVTIVRFPDIDDAVDEDGNEIDYRSLAHMIGENARSGDTVAMPSSLVSKGGVDDEASSVYEWDISILENKNNFQALEESFKNLEILKLRALFVPEQSLVEGAAGSSSRNVADTYGNLLEESQAATIAEIDDHINNYMIPQLIEINFPDKKGIECKKVTTGLGDSDVQLSKALVQLIGQRNPEKLEVDIREVLKEAGVPIKSPKQLENELIAEAERAQELMEQQMNMQPPQDGGAKPPGEKVGIPSGNPQYKDIGFSEDFNLEDIQETFNLTIREFNAEDADVLAFYDEDNSMIFLADSLTDKEKQNYLTNLITTL